MVTVLRTLSVLAVALLLALAFLPAPAAASPPFGVCVLTGAGVSVSNAEPGAYNWRVDSSHGCAPLARGMLTVTFDSGTVVRDTCQEPAFCSNFLRGTAPTGDCFTFVAVTHGTISVASKVAGAGCG